MQSLNMLTAVLLNVCGFCSFLTKEGTCGRCICEKSSLILQVLTHCWIVYVTSYAFVWIQM